MGYLRAAQASFSFLDIENPMSDTGAASRPAGGHCSRRPSRPGFCVTTRLAFPDDDNDAIMSVMGEAWRDDLFVLHWIHDDLSARCQPELSPRWFLAEGIGGEPIGAACWSPSDRDRCRANLTWTAVRPRFRHRGVAASLLDARLADCASRCGGLDDYIQVCTWPAPLYLDRGFVVTSAPPSSTGKVVMTRPAIHSQRGSQ